MPEAVNLGYAFGLKPEKAIEYFESKGYKITWDWREQWQEAHTRAFTVAGVTKIDVLQDIRGALTDALNNGSTLAEFEKQLTPILQRKGWWGKQAQVDKETGEMFGKGLTPYRLKTIYQANMQSAYMAGRHQSMLENVESRPLWEYVAILDSRTRPSHRALDGKVFRYDDPFWDAFYPPNGFNCRCRVRARDADDLRAAGKYLSNGYGRMEDVEVAVNRRLDKATVTGYREPVTGNLFRPDAGWSYNPAKHWAKPFTPPPLDDLPKTFTPGIALPDLPMPAVFDITRLVAADLEPEAYAKAFLNEFNADIGKAVVYKDVAGDALVIDEALFKDAAGNWKADKDGRGSYMRLLADAVKAPDEIWLRWEESRNAPGTWLLKRRYIKSFINPNIKGQQYGLSVFEFGQDGWTGSTAMMANLERSEEARKRYIEKQRDGFLRYRK